jgi:hypothetical protein
VPWGVPAVYYAVGRTQQASTLEAVLTKRFANDHDFRLIWLPLIDASAALNRRDFDAALEKLHAAEAFERSRPGVTLLRGRILFGAARYQDAAAAFQRAIDNRFIAEPTPLGTVATIWLARSRVKLGDTAGARRAYQDALTAWKDADPEIPILVEAKKEYEGLPPS